MNTSKDFILLERFRLLIKELADLIQLEIRQNIGNAVELNWNSNKITLYLEQNNNQGNVILSMDLGIVSTDSEADIYPMLLEGNYLWSATGGATIGVDSESRKAIICQSYQLQELSSRQLILEIEEICKVSNSWAQLIAEKNETARKSQSSQNLAHTLLRV